MSRVKRPTGGDSGSGQQPQPQPQLVFLLVGNKSDIDREIGTTGSESSNHKREVTYDEGSKLAERFGCWFMETSAKTGQNVEKIFTHMVRALRHRRDETSVHASASVQSASGSSKARRFSKTKKNLKKKYCIIA
jgi:GTPase SAR1 family protein